MFCLFTFIGFNISLVLRISATCRFILRYYLHLSSKKGIGCAAQKIPFNLLFPLKVQTSMCKDFFFSVMSVSFQSTPAWKSVVFVSSQNRLPWPWSFVCWHTLWQQLLGTSCLVTESQVTFCCHLNQIHLCWLQWYWLLWRHTPHTLSFSSVEGWCLFFLFFCCKTIFCCFW